MKHCPDPAGICCGLAILLVALAVIAIVLEPML